MAAVSLDQFSKQLTESGVMSEEDLQAFLGKLPADAKPADGEQLAKRLVREKKISAYQAQVIYSGKGKSLTMGGYFVLDKLGQGGMGMVLKAEHRMMKRLVAIKVLSPAVTKTKESQQRFQREVEAAARLTHPNIVGAFDAGESNGSPFLVMEYVPGDDLSSVVKKKGPLSVDQAIDCIAQAARGLEFAHKQGVIHRDIKPANLLLDTSGAVKILDMGLARIDSADVATQADLTGTGAVMGTVDYMAPEQAVNTKTADARSDLYSLGISLWFLLTAKAAYEGDSLMSRLLAHRDQPIPSLRAVRDDVSESLDAVFRKLVAKKAADRYQTATELMADLAACRTGASVKALVVAEVATGTEDFQDFLQQLDSPTIGPRGSQSSPSVTGTKTQARARQSITSLDETMERSNVSDTLPPARRVRKGGKSKSPPWFQDIRVQIGGGAAAVLLLLAAIFLFQTPNGTLRVEILDPEVEVKVQGTTVILKGADLEPVSLKAGEKKLLVTRGDLSFETDSFTLKQGAETKVKVDLVADSLIATSGGKVLGEKSVGRRTISTSTTGGNSASPTSRTPSASPPPNTSAPPSAVAPFDAQQARGHQEAWAKYLGVPVEFTNSLGMKFKLIPPGEFMMGFDPKEIDSIKNHVIPEGWRQGFAERIAAAAPLHKVRITRPFYIQTYEVTNGQYQKIIGKLPELNDPNTPDMALMRSVSLIDFVRFCDELSRKEGKTPAHQISGDRATRILSANGYRLPTEAEWEYTCRAGTTTLWFLGDDRRVASGSTILREYQSTHVGTAAKPNPFGLFDQYAGSSEWCFDRYSPYGSESMTDPFEQPGDIGAITRGGHMFAGGGADPVDINSVARNPGGWQRNTYGGLGRVVLPIEMPAQGITAAAKESQPKGAKWDKIAGSVAPPAVSPASPTGEVIDLLAKVELPGDCVKRDRFGDWTREGQTLVSPPANTPGLVTVRYEPPPEYELTAVVERRTGTDGVIFGVNVDGHPAGVCFDMYGGPLSGISLIDGKHANENEATVKQVVLADSKPHTIRILVGRRSVRGSVDDREIVHWEGDPQRLSSNEVFPNPKQLWFGAGYHQFKLHKLELRPVVNANNSAAGTPNVSPKPTLPATADVHWPFDTNDGNEYEWSEPENLAGAINTQERQLFASLTSDEKIIVYKSGKKLMIGQRESRDVPFLKVEPLPESVNGISGIQESSSLSGDGLQLGFVVREGGGADIWISRRATTAESFATPERMLPPVNSVAMENNVAFSLDGLTLCVSSTRPGKFAGSDAFSFTRLSSTADFGNEQNLGRNVNAAGMIIPSWISNDRNVLIATAMVKSPFQTSWHRRTSPNETFGAAQSLGSPFDKTMIGGARVSADGQRLYFHSRDFKGGRGELDIWLTRRVPKTAARLGVAVHLDDLQETAYEGLDRVRKPGNDEESNGSLKDNFLGISAAHGLIIHPQGEPAGTCRVTYDLAGRYETLEGTAFCRPHRNPPVFSEIVGDGKSLWKSNDLTRSKTTGSSFVVNVRGVRQLALMATSEVNAAASHVLWKEPRLSPLSQDQAALNVPAEALTFGGHRYLLVESFGTWKEAKAKAEAVGGHLATINSRAERDWVLENVWRKRPHQEDGGWSMFIGGTCVGDRWKWVTDEPFDPALSLGQIDNLPDHGLVWFTDTNWGLADVNNVNSRFMYFLIEWDTLGLAVGKMSRAVAPFDAAQARAHQEAWAKHLGTTVETTNSVGAKMVLVPPGEFLMGSTVEQVEAALKVAEELGDDQAMKNRIQKPERPQHRVVLTKPLMMGATEVTVGQFKKFVEATKYLTEAEQYGFSDSSEKVLTDKVTKGQKQTNWRRAGAEVTDDSPVTQITWNDAVAYCNWLSTQEKVTYRLPTEAEWEFACRAGTTTQFSFGDDVALFEQYGWYNKNAASKSHQVGAKRPNGFGLYDLHGSLAEWCQDFYEEKWYAKSPSNDPNGPSTGFAHVIRGGYQRDPASACRSATRFSLPPSLRSYAIGFRCVRAFDIPTTTVSGVPPTTDPAFQ